MDKRRNCAHLDECCYTYRLYGAKRDALNPNRYAVSVFTLDSTHCTSLNHINHNQLYLLRPFSWLQTAAQTFGPWSCSGGLTQWRACAWLVGPRGGRARPRRNVARQRPFGTCRHPQRRPLAAFPLGTGLAFVLKSATAFWSATASWGGQGYRSSISTSDSAHSPHFSRSS